MWLSFFLLFWHGLVNMNLSSIKQASIALPMAWIEMVIAAWLALWSYKKFSGIQNGDDN